MQETPSPLTFSINPIKSLKRHYRVSLLVFVALILVGTPVAIKLGTSTYSADATFMVAPRFMKNVQSDQEVEFQSNSQYRQFVNHIRNSVTRDDVLRAALERLSDQGIDPKPAGMTLRRYIEQLQRSVVTIRVPNTYMLQVRLSGGENDRGYLDKIVNAIVTVFIEIHRQEGFYGADERLEVLAKSKGKLEREIQDWEDERAKLAVRLGRTTFARNLDNPFDTTLFQVREALTVASVKLETTESVYRAFIEDQGLPQEAAARIADQLDRAPEVAAEQFALIDAREELLAYESALTPLHPARIRAQETVKELQSRLKQVKKQARERLHAEYRDQLSAQLTSERQTVEGLTRKLDRLEQQATEYTKAFQRALRLSDYIRINRERIEQIQSRMNYLETETEALGFLRIVTPALPADMPQGLGHTKAFAALLIFALGAAMSVPVVIDFLDPRLLTVREAEKIIGIPTAGWQILKEDLPTELFAQRQSRQFVAALMRSRARHDKNIFAFSALKTKGGATTTILDTAKHIQELGSSVIIVEANTFTPAVQFKHARAGLTDSLANGLSHSDLIYRTEHDAMSLEFVGIGTQARKGLTRVDRLKDLLETLGQRYDYVLVDLPPLMASPDAEIAIGVIGQIFLVIQAETVTKAEVRKAGELLRKIDPDAVGIFVNQVSLERSPSYLEQNIVEGLTRSQYAQFDGGQHWRFRLQLWLAIWREWLKDRWSGKR